MNQDGLTSGSQQLWTVSTKRRTATSKMMLPAASASALHRQKMAKTKGTQGISLFQRYYSNSIAIILYLRKIVCQIFTLHLLESLKFVYGKFAVR